MLMIIFLILDLYVVLRMMLILRCASSFVSHTCVKCSMLIMRIYIILSMIIILVMVVEVTTTAIIAILFI